MIPSESDHPGLRNWNIDFSSIMCCEQPLARYHDWCFFPTIKEVCNKSYFVLRYPKSFWVLFLCQQVGAGKHWIDPLMGCPFQGGNCTYESHDPLFHRNRKCVDFFTMYNLFAFENMARFVFGVSLHLNNLVKGFMPTDKLAQFISQGFYLLIEFYNLKRQFL